VFIDDRDVNVRGARKAGMEAVQFVSAEQVSSELKMLGIL